MIRRTRSLRAFWVGMFVIVLAGAVVFSAVSDVAAQRVQRMSLATAGTAGAWYPLGVGIANLVTEKVPGLILTAEVTAGGVENVRLVDRGEAEFAFANFDAAYFGYYGQGPYNRPHAILGLTSLYPSSLQMAVLADSDIYTVEDLRGKRVVVGPPASSSAVMGWDVLAAHGIRPSDIRGLMVSFAEGADLMRDGNADALFIMSAHPNSALLDLQTQRPIRLIPISAEKRAEITAQFPYYINITIPAGTYDGQTEPVETLGLGVMIIAREDVPEETAYQVVKTIFENLDRARTFHASAHNIDPATAAQVPIPLHPGALRYFEERGLLP